VQSRQGAHGALGALRCAVVLTERGRAGPCRGVRAWGDARARRPDRQGEPWASALVGHALDPLRQQSEQKRLLLERFQEEVRPCAGSQQWKALSPASKQEHMLLHAAAAHYDSLLCSERTCVALSLPSDGGAARAAPGLRLLRRGGERRGAQPAHLHGRPGRLLAALALAALAERRAAGPGQRGLHRVLGRAARARARTAGCAALAGAPTARMAS
jgi:hypothetical protein